MNYWFDPKHVEGVIRDGDGKRIIVTLTSFLDLRKATVSTVESHYVDRSGKVDHFVNIKDGSGFFTCCRLIGAIEKMTQGQTVTANILDAKTIIIESGAEPKRQELIRGEIQ